MALKWGKGKTILALIAIIFLNTMMMEDLAIYPILDEMYAAFPGQEVLVSTWLSMTNFFAIFLSLLIPFILKKVSHRSILVAAAVLGGIGNIFGVAVENIYFMLAMRALCAFSYTVVNVMFTIIIADIYSDGKMRAWFLAIFNAFTSIFGAVLSFGGGILGTSGWQNTWKIYLFFSIPMIVLAIFFIPGKKDIDWSMHEASTTSETAEGTAAGKKEPLGKRFWILAISFLLFNYAYTSWSSFSSFYISENELGSAALVGTLGTLNTAVSAVSSLAFAVIYNKIKGKTGLIAAIGMCASFVIWSFFPTVPTTVFAAALNGAAYGLMWSHLYQYASDLVPFSRLDSACALLGTMCTLCFATSSYVWPVVQSALGSFNGVIKICMIISVIPVVIELFAPDPLKNKRA